MSQAQPNPFSLRALAKAAQVTASPPATSRSPHALGLGISARHRYRSVSGIVSRLPSADAGLVHLRQSTSRAVLGLPPDYSASAWGVLLGRPQLVVDLPTTELDNFLKSGQVISLDSVQGTIRHLGLAVIAMPDSVALTREHELVATPAAGVAQIVLATRERADISSDAWIVAHWYDSAEETATALADLHAMSGAALPTSLPASAMLLTDSTHAWRNGVLDERIISCASLLDYQITGYAPQDYMHKAMLHVRRTSPDILLIADSSVSRCTAVIDAYLATSKADGIRFCEPGDLRDLISVIRRRLIVASGVSLNLLAIAEAAQAHPEEARGRLPIKKPGRRLHHERFGVYIECQESGYFYVIDKARHAGVMAKRYTLKADGLHWDADLDKNGVEVIGKFKGEVGMFIPLNELGGA
jgi:hypothetical protein